MIAIVDTGGANHASIQNAFARMGLECSISTDTGVLDRATHLILPGVGHAGFAMKRLRQQGLIAYLKEQTKPVLGICLGMQILFSSTEEGQVTCLDVLPGRVTKLLGAPDFRVPHMGWSQVERTGRDSVLLANVPADAYFYFVHSYQVPSNDWVVARTAQGIPAIVERRNFVATQFHPERSGQVGAMILKNFVQWSGQ